MYTLAAKRKKTGGGSDNPRDQASAIAASRLIEEAYMLLFKRVQDEPETTTRTVAWKASVLERLDKVRTLNF